ncbi:geranylgeranyl transferase type-2 subunit alpha isoform X2 [Anas platyrhynchos]|uniref:geranylgeranyl transferase type-2 subunit alpha isoform X2 n=1 Tax=Anas platyrhynchos TaxID=8839 RepID=UPI003AF26B61
MHGRLKLRPPDAARRKQREEKLRRYRVAMATLIDKRGRGELDAEVVELTGAVLAANPDVGTCWNLRRRALELLGGDWVPGELAFVGGCLGVNPKSYGAWHHRRWVLRHAPPDPAAQRAFCARLLEADPRNFHAWEHRRAEAGEAAEAELAFTAQLLARDFSNFSAWHHRGRLLADGPLPPERLRQELELVQNAVFTDPQDQSAWVYLRCLLARATPPPRLLSLHADLEDGTLAAAFSRPVLVSPGSLEASLEDRPLPGPWRPADGRPRPSCFWLCPLPPGLATPPARLRVAWQRGPAHFVTLRPGETEAWWQEPIEARELIWPEVGVSDPAVLSELAQACRELLELEPRSRGCLLTLSLLLGALGPREHGEELRRCLRCLQVLDVSRNRVRSLRGLPPLPRLEELRLDGNPISHASDLAPLAACPRLARLRLVGTPLAAAPEAAAQLDKLLPHVAVALA